jgi:hypothetical protein
VGSIVRYSKRKAGAKMQKKPSVNGANGRDSKGQFVKGNPGGPGNPLVKRVHRIRTLMLTEVDEADLRAIVKKLIAMAKAGDLAAIREVLDRCLGKSATFILMHQFEEDFAWSRMYPLPGLEKDE